MRAMILFSGYLRLRKGEMFALLWSDIDLFGTR
jgi:hypothetical protein